MTRGDGATGGCTISARGSTRRAVFGAEADLNICGAQHYSVYDPLVRCVTCSRYPDQQRALSCPDLTCFANRYAAARRYYRRYTGQVLELRMRMNGYLRKQVQVRQDWVDFAGQEQQELQQLLLVVN